MSKFSNWIAQTIFLHAPQDISEQEGTVTKVFFISKSNLQTLQLQNAYLRSRIGTPSFFNEGPSFFQKSSQFSADTLVSQERPIAFKKSAGDLINSG